MAKKNNGFDLTKIIEFCKKHVKYIAAGVVVVILVIVLAIAAAKSGTGDKPTADDGQNNEENQQPEGAQNTLVEGEFQVDAIPEINTLIQNYYTAYAAGDTAALEGYASPITELEKNYITLMSQYVASYENVQCRTKAGLSEGEYAVSVTMEMRIEGVESTAPGLDFFYVRKNEEGVYYIDNLYCSFNQENRVLEMDSQVEAFIAEYEQQEDFVTVFNDVQARYDAALAADENLKNKLDVEIPQGVLDWWNALASAAGVDQEEQQPETAPEAPADQTQQPETPADQAQQPETPADQTQQPEETPETQPETSADQTQQPAESQGEQGGNKLTYVPDGTVMTASSSYNLRESMSENSRKLGTTAAGDEIKVIMSYAEGWTKVEWKDKKGYIRTDLLLNN